MKHAGPGASAAVRLDLTPGDVRVEVQDDGDSPGAGGGLGAEPASGAAA